MDPSAQQVEGDVHGREEQHEEDRHLHDRACLHRAQPHGDAACPEDRRRVHDCGEHVQGGEVDAVSSDLHADCEGDRGEERGGDEPAAECGRRVPDDDAGAVRRREEKPPREAGLEVACDSEAGEYAAERGRLEEDEDELERGVPLREVEPAHVVDARQPPGERGEEEERERELRDEEGGIREDVVQRPPRDRSGDGDVAHQRASRFGRATDASERPTTATIATMPNPSASALPFQPVMMRLRTHSSR